MASQPAKRNTRASGQPLPDLKTLIDEGYAAERRRRQQRLPATANMAGTAPASVAPPEMTSAPSRKETVARARPQTYSPRTPTRATVAEPGKRATPPHLTTTEPGKRVSPSRIPLSGARIHHSEGAVNASHEHVSSRRAETATPGRTTPRAAVKATGMSNQPRSAKSQATEYYSPRNIPLPSSKASSPLTPLSQKSPLSPLSLPHQLVNIGDITG
ncbi:hypothetical protein K474DRAFT_897041 [Panus rudis PR-1116 ss-1]|nr:hypothetical protein K474DRAFT_897041 [Panus rudis PR-1116 ss-1]